MLLIKSGLKGYLTRRIHCFVNHLSASLSNVFEAHPFPELNNLDVTVDVVNQLIIDRSLKRDLHDEFGKFQFGWQHCYPTRSGEVSHAAQGTALGQAANNRGLHSRLVSTLFCTTSATLVFNSTRKITNWNFSAFSVSFIILCCFYQWKKLTEFERKIQAKTPLVDSRMARIRQLLQETWLRFWTL